MKQQVQQIKAQVWQRQIMENQYFYQTVQCGIVNNLNL